MQIIASYRFLICVIVLQWIWLKSVSNLDQRHVFSHIFPDRAPMQISSRSTKESQSSRNNCHFDWFSFIHLYLCVILMFVTYSNYFASLLYTPESAVCLWECKFVCHFLLFDHYLGTKDTQFTCFLLLIV